MIPPLVPLLDAAAPVVALVGTQIFQDEAPIGTAGSYVVWRLISGQAENYVSEPPEMDNFRVQIDCYAATGAASRALAKAVRNALVSHAQQIAIGMVGKDVDTQLWRYGFDWSFWTPRT